MQDFLPVTREDMKSRGWDELDFVYVTGDAYVDHPSFGSAIIGRLLESRGYRVGMIPQPDWRKKEHPGVRGTAPGFSRYSRKHGFHGESLYGFQKAPKHRCLFSGRKNGIKTGQGFCCIQQSDPADL